MSKINIFSNPNVIFVPLAFYGDVFTRSLLSWILNYLSVMYDVIAYLSTLVNNTCVFGYFLMCYAEACNNLREECLLCSGKTEIIIYPLKSNQRSL